MSIYETYYLNRPQAANALDLETAKEIAAKVAQAVKNKSRGLIISSLSSRIFCSGGDLRSYDKMKTKQEGVRANAGIRKILQSFAKAPLTVVASIEGDCIGGGCELALACDYVVAGELARFAFRQSVLGLSFGWGGAEPLFRRIHHQVTHDWIMSGRWITAVEAARSGFVNQVVPAGQADVAAGRFIEGLEGLDPGLVLKMKNLIRQGGHQEAKVFEGLWYSKPHRDALQKVLKGLKGN